MKKSGLVVILVLVVLQGGCANLGPGRWSGSGEKRQADVLKVAYRAADHLHAQLKGGEAVGYPMLAASFVESSDLDSASDLGRLISEQIASRLSQHGYSVAEVQLRADQLALGPSDGVLALSRDPARIDLDVDAYSILVGTCTTIERQIFVNARVVRVSDGVALASSDFTLPLVHQRGSGRADAQPSVRTVLR